MAHLARIKLSDIEIESLQHDISGILGYVSQVATVSPDGAVDGVREVPQLRNIMRDDAPYDASVPIVGHEEAIRSAFPKREGEYNVVRKIISKDE